MKIAQLNMVHNGSTGTIMLNIAKTARSLGHEVKTYSAVPFIRGKKNGEIKIAGHSFWGSRMASAFHYYGGRAFGINGLLSRRGTKQLLSDLEKFKPDILHLHNLHSFCINFPKLFEYIKKNSIKTVWTLHDCWAFTGHCPHFVTVGCEKWKTGCSDCPLYRQYPKSLVDDSKRMYRLKQRWFCGVKDMTLVTPSRWLGDLTRQSFLKDYSVTQITNGIDLSVFKPVESDFKSRIGCEGKKLVLGVSSGWSNKKGLDVFIELEKRFDDNYVFVLVGTSDSVSRRLPSGIISVPKTNSAEELARIYSAADVFVNPTREDTFPTVNIEALACGTPVVTFNTGGSPEIVDQSCGSVVACNDTDELEKEIKRVCVQMPYSPEDCVKRASAFDMNSKFKEYVKLYEDIAYRT